MANLYEIKQRMRSIGETKQITKAMKLISAAKLKKARSQLNHVLPYFTRTSEIIGDILLHSSNIQHPFFDLENKRTGKKISYIILTGDKGLCGSYNHNIHKFAESHINADDRVKLFIAGNIGRSYFRKKGYNVDPEFIYPVQKPTIYRAIDISNYIVDLYNKEEIDEVYIIYTLLVSSLDLQPKIQKLLPLEMDAFLDKPQKSDSFFDLKYEPSPEAVLEVLVNKYLKSVIYGAFVESFTSEQSSRMYAMDQATTNANEILADLKLNYNNIRQTIITQEINEIIGGSEALIGAD